jgi:ArsR family transcriptional regulator
MNSSLDETALVFKALAHPCRLRLLISLAREHTCDVTTLMHLCEQRQPYISEQLRILRRLGVVIGNHDGQRVCYRIATPRIAAILRSAGLLDSARPLTRGSA